MKILSFWAMIFFFCLVFWFTVFTVFVYLGIPLLIVGAIVLVATLVFGGKSDDEAALDEDKVTDRELEK